MQGRTKAANKYNTNLVKNTHCQHRQRGEKHIVECDEIGVK